MRMCCGLFATPQFHFECCGVLDDSRCHIYIYIFFEYLIIHTRDVAKKHETIVEGQRLPSPNIMESVRRANRQ